MRPFFLSLILCFSIASTSAQNNLRTSQRKSFDLIHTKLDLIPIWETKALKGTAELKLKPWFYDQKKLILDAKGFEIYEIKVDGKQIEFSYDLVQITIPFQNVISVEDTIIVEIDYLAKPEELGEISALNDLKTKGLYFVNYEKSPQLWTEGETQNNSCWFPTLDSPNQKHTQEISLRVPQEFISLSNGILTQSISHDDGSRTDTWKQELPHAVYLTMIATGDFEKIVDSTYQKFEISYYVEPEFKDEAYAIFGRTPEMMNYFDSLLNIPYPWNKYSQIAVRDYISGAMENTTATVHGNSIQKNRNQLVDENNDAVIAHELFHHWFGNLATAESWSNLALNESFADYSEYLWANFKYGTDEGDWTNYLALNQYLSESEEKQVAVIRFQYDDKEDMFDSHSYAKGGRILQMLRQEVGDEAFFKSLNLYLKDRQFKNAEIHHLRLAFESVTGRDLNWFFNQWFLSPGHPRIEVNHSVKDNVLKIELIQKLDSKNQQTYKFPLSIAIGTSDSIYHKKIEVQDVVQQLDFKLDSDFLFLSIDPKGFLLGDIKHESSIEELINQYNSLSEVVARAKIFDNITFEAENAAEKPIYKGIVRDFVINAMDDPYWRIREKAIHQFFDYEGDDFLMVEKKLQTLVLGDDKPQVRSAAILAMKNFLNPQNNVLFREALADTSYSVRAAALEAIFISQPPDADSLAESFREIKDINIFMAVANHLATKANEEDFEWFQARITDLTGMELYQSLGIFGSYLVLSNPEIQLASIPFLKDIAINESIWVGRFAASQALVLLTEHQEAIRALQEIIMLEKEPRLQNLYQQIRLR